MSSFNDTALLNEHIENYEKNKSDSSYLFLKETAKRSPFHVSKRRAIQVLKDNGVNV